MTSFSLEHVFSKKLVLVTGKGGVGKSLVTACLGLIAANRGLKTLVIERSEQEQLSELFGLSSVGHRETKIMDNLSCINLDQTKCFEEYVVKQLGQKKLFEKVFSHNIVKTFLNTIPGLGESMLLGRMFYTCELADPRPYDLVLFDAPASGHMQNLMTTPQAIIDSGIGGPLVREITRVRDFFASQKKVGTIVTTVAEELVVSELIDFLPRLQKESPANILGVIVNRTVADNDIQELRKYQKLISSQGNDLRKMVDSLLLKNVRKLENQSILAERLKNLSKLDSKDYDILSLPDLGSIPEPIDVGFALSLFGGD
jgi:anion-transporting  ArsA/GET3 family ATPase